MTTSDSVGWAAGLDDLHEIATRITGAFGNADPAREADLAIKMFGAIMGAYLQHLWADPAHPAFLPSVGYYQMYGTPNPDTIYRTAAIDGGGGEYLISGRRGTVADVSIMPFGRPTERGLQTFAPFTFDDLDTDSEGWFDVVLSRERPDAASNWWRLDPQMRTLMLRSVSYNWGAELEPRLAIVRLDTSPRRERVAAEVITQRLRAFGAVVEGMMMSGLRRTQQLRADGVVNRVIDVDYSANGGLARQWYQEGYFTLGEREALVLEACVPVGCDAFSLSLTDEFFSTIDWANAQSSLNHRQARLDSDGVLRLVVAATDPGVPNWLDTTGHPSGALQLRWLGGEAPPTVRVTMTSIEALNQVLPEPIDRINPADRAQIIRRRQAGVQLRTHW